MHSLLARRVAVRIRHAWDRATVPVTTLQETMEHLCLSVDSVTGVLTVILAVCVPHRLLLVATGARQDMHHCPMDMGWLAIDCQGESLRTLSTCGAPYAYATTPLT